MWNQGIITPITKCYTKDIREPTNSRGITLASSVYKLYCSILNERLLYFNEKCNLTTDSQNGFRKGRSCVDHLETLTSIVETRKLLKRSTYLAYIDFSRAYDGIRRDYLWYKLEKMGLNVESKFLCALKSLYRNVKSSVRLQGCFSHWFQVNVGLKQGCLLSTTLFNLYINDLASNIDALKRGVRIHNEQVSLLMYADDLVLLAETSNDLQCMLDELNSWCSTWDVNINVQKSKIMHCRGKGTPLTNSVFHCGDKILELCTKYKY